MINLNNYETWMLDYFDGNLSSNDEALLREFLSKHPELNESLTDDDLPVLHPEKKTFDNKEILYNPLITDSEDLQIADLEGDLSISEREAYKNDLNKQQENIYNKTIVPKEDFIIDKKDLYSNQFNERDIDDLILASLDDSLSKEGEAWMKEHLSKSFINKQKEILSAIYITPDTSIKYPSKEELKRRKPIVLYIRRAVAVAAMLAMVFYSAHLWQINDDNSGFAVIVDEPTIIKDDNQVFEKEQLAKVEITDPISADDGTPNDVNGQTTADEDLPIPSKTYANVNRMNGNNDIIPAKVKKANPDDIGVKAIANASNSSGKFKQIDFSRRVIEPNKLNTVAANGIHRPISPIKLNHKVNNVETVPLKNEMPSSFASELKVDVPEIYYKLADVVGQAQEAYVSGKQTERKVMDLKLGPISFYRSSKR